MNSDPTDEELMLAVRHGRLDRMGELFDRHHRRVFGLLRGLGLDFELAEDATQEAFARALRYRRSFRQGRRFLPWFLAIARNAARTRGVYEREPTVGEPEQVQRIEDPTALEAFDLTGVEARELREALSRIPLLQREALLLTYFHELESPEVAELLGTTARSRPRARPSCAAEPP